MKKIDIIVLTFLFTALAYMLVLSFVKYWNYKDDKETQAMFMFINKGNGGELKPKEGDTLTVSKFHPHKDLEKWVYDGGFWNKIKSK